MSDTLINTVVIGTVVRVEAYGVYFSYGESTILVLIPDVSDDPIPDLQKFIAPGERRPVKILRQVVGKAKEYMGSMREA